MHIKGFFPSWTESMCPFKSGCCVNLEHMESAHEGNKPDTWIQQPLEHLNSLKSSSWRMKKIWVHYLCFVLYTEYPIKRTYRIFQCIEKASILHEQMTSEATLRPQLGKFFYNWLIFDPNTKQTLQYLYWMLSKNPTYSFWRNFQPILLFRLVVYSEL